MKNFRRIITMLLAFTLLLSNSVSFAASFSDVTDNTQFKNSITTLTTMRLIKGYEDGTFKPDNTITRAEFTTIVVRALGLDNVSVSGAEETFIDVSQHYAKFNIKTAYDLKIINGFEDNTFRPDETVTYEQAVKMIVCMLGYGVNGEANGGYPSGYLAVGGQLDITKDISIATTSPASRGVVAKLIDNSLNVKLQQSFTLADGTYSYTITDNTIMESKLGIKRVKALVTAVGKSVIISDDNELLDGEMRISTIPADEAIILNYSKVYANSSEISQYLGHIIYLYYKDNDDNERDELIAIDSVTEKNTVTEITSKEIDSFNNNKLTFIKNSQKSSSIKINLDDLSIIYNGKVVSKNSNIPFGNSSVSLSQAITKWLTPDSENFINGELKIIDSGSDGTADVIFITNYSVIVAASSPSISDYRITNKILSGNFLTLNPEDDSYSFTITKAGTIIQPSAIKANDVILYATSLDGELITAIVNSSPVTGTISETDGEEMLINGVTYYITESCKNYLSENTTLSVGTQGTFYIDKYNNVIFCTVDVAASSPTNYAYLLNLSENLSTDSYYATLFAPTLSSTETKKLPFDDKISLNNSNIKTENLEKTLKETSSFSQDDITNASAVYGSSANEAYTNGIAQLVKVGVKNNEVNSIITLSDESGLVNADPTKLVKYKPLAKYTYSATNNFSNEFYINSSTTVLYVPGNRTNKSDYQKFNASSIFKTKQSYWLEAYDVNDGKIASLVVVYGNSSLADITKDTVMSVVAKKPTDTIVSDDTVHKLTLYMSSISLTTKNTDNNTTFADVLPGDIIQFGHNNNNRAINRKNIIGINDVKEVLNAGTNIYDWTDDKFNYYYKDDEDGDGIYNIVIDSETNLPYSRAFVANVIEVIKDDTTSYLRVTQSGFDKDGKIITDDADHPEERYEILSNTPIVLFKSSANSSSDALSIYADGTTTKLSIDDFKDSKYSGTNCSKVFMYTLKGEVKFIMIYE